MAVGSTSTTQQVKLKYLCLILFWMLCVNIVPLYRQVFQFPVQSMENYSLAFNKFIYESNKKFLDIFQKYLPIIKQGRKFLSLLYARKYLVAYSIYNYHIRLKSFLCLLICEET